MASPLAAAQVPSGECCEPAPLPPPPTEAIVKKEQKIREVHVSVALMEEFLRSEHLVAACKCCQCSMNSMPSMNITAASTSEQPRAAQ